MTKVITSVVDDGEYMEYHANWAKAITCGFARLDGQPVGIGQSADDARRCARHRVLVEGRPLRPHV
ncbi:MAG: carboxyl transferase domain-containing protein [Acidimicrobiales bacterium]